MDKGLNAIFNGLKKIYLIKIFDLNLKYLSFIYIQKLFRKIFIYIKKVLTRFRSKDLIKFQKLYKISYISKNLSLILSNILYFSRKYKFINLGIIMQKMK